MKEKIYAVTDRNLNVSILTHSEITDLVLEAKEDTIVGWLDDNFSATELFTMCDDDKVLVAEKFIEEVEAGRIYSWAYREIEIDTEVRM